MGKVAVKRWCWFVLIMFLVWSLECGVSEKVKAKKPCKRLVLFYHDHIMVGKDGRNASSVAIANTTLLGNFQMGEMIIFDDPVTRDRNLTSDVVAKARGLYFYDAKKGYDAWFAFTLIFNSSEHKGSINIMGADPLGEKTRDLSVVGGTGDFFMTRGIATF